MIDSGLNPLEIGSICNKKYKVKKVTKKLVSIPLKSGLFVILAGLAELTMSVSLNPLEIGSICNLCI